MDLSSSQHFTLFWVWSFSHYPTFHIWTDLDKNSETYQGGNLLHLLTIRPTKDYNSNLFLSKINSYFSLWLLLMSESNISFYCILIDPFMKSTRKQFVIKIFSQFSISIVIWIVFVSLENICLWMGSLLILCRLLCQWVRLDISFSPNQAIFSKNILYF